MKSLVIFSILTSSSALADRVTLRPGDQVTIRPGFESTTVSCETGEDSIKFCSIRYYMNGCDVFLNDKNIGFYQDYATCKKVMNKYVEQKLCEPLL